MVARAAERAACERCGGRGWVIEAEEAGPGTARPCGCRREELVPRLLAAAKIPPRFRDRTLDSFDAGFGASAAERDQRLEALETSRRYVDEFITEAGRFRDTGLLFIGRPGVGKTHLAVGVLTELIRRYRVRGLFVDFTALLHEIRSTFEPGTASSSSRVLHPVTDAEVAVIDDLGAQKSSDWVREILYLILNSRYANRLPTLFTTNFRLEPVRPAVAPVVEDGYSDFVGASVATVARSALATETAEYELVERLPPTLVSRLYEMAEPVVIEAGDYRRSRLQKRPF